MGNEMFRFDGKRALVVGGASGIGAAAARQLAELGAEVLVLDHADVDFPVAAAIRVDLRDKEAIDAALDEIAAPVDALLSCAGVADGTPGLMTINFIAHRHIIERLVDEGTMRPGSAIAMISSVGGLGWEVALPILTDFLASPDFESAQKWVDTHGTDNYVFSKQAINAYVARQALPLLTRGIRINSILPGPTDTPLARANAQIWLGFAADYRDAAGVEPLTAEQNSNVLCFLCSEASSGITGMTVLVDQGYVHSALVDSFHAPFVKTLLGRA